MSDKKIRPASFGVRDSATLTITQVWGTAPLGLLEVFWRMAYNTPEEAAVSLRSATRGGLTDEWELDEEEELVQLWLVEEDGMVCGGSSWSYVSGSLLRGEAG
jgi:hypothetical protein